MFFAAISRNQLLIRSQSVIVIMSMETFQNVDEWLVSTDVSSVLTSSWIGEEEYGFVGGLDDDIASEGYLTSPCPADGSGCHNVTDLQSSPLQSKHLVSSVL